MMMDTKKLAALLDQAERDAGVTHYLRSEAHEALDGLTPEQTRAVRVLCHLANLDGQQGVPYHSLATEEVASG